MSESRDHIGNSRTEIILCTRNSAKFLDKFLESIASQTNDDFHLVVSDDCSTDETIDIVKAHQTRFRHPVQLTCRTQPSGGARNHYAELLLRSKADYVFIADHDDIWLPHKIENGLSRLRRLESIHGVNKPILAHGDLRVIDGADRITHPSFWAFKAIDPAYGLHIETALMHASVVGCTVGVNRALLARIGEIPPAAIMHDWWINLIAAAMGIVDYDSEPHILYRIYGQNASQPKRASLGRALSNWNNLREGRLWIKRRLDQGKAFREAYRDECPAEVRRALDSFLLMAQAGPIRRRYLFSRSRFRSPDRWRNVAALIFI